MPNSIKCRQRELIRLAAWVLLIGLVAGCASKQESRENFGILQPSTEVSKIFESYQVLPNYKYFFTGSETKPLAIMGIDRNYTLVTRLWKEAADLTPEQLKGWVNQIGGFRPPFRTYGAHILGPAGQQVGIWYSLYDDSQVKMLGDKQIEVVPPSYMRKPSLPKGMKGFGIGF
jgi:hypothetical protein